MSMADPPTLEVAFVCITVSTLGGSERPMAQMFGIIQVVCDTRPSQVPFSPAEMNSIMAKKTKSSNEFLFR